VSNGTEYFVAPRQPGVRPQDPPDYDGIQFVYVFTQVLDPWIQPAVQANVTLVVANAQGFVPGMTIVIENAGYFEVVSTDALNRMTVQNFGTSYNQPPGTPIAPGKITTTSLPGPPGGIGPQGPPGPAGRDGVNGQQGSPGVPGATGPTGAQGATGPQGAVGPQGPPGGASTFSNLTSTFTMPAVNATALASVTAGTAGQFSLGGIVYISPIGYLSITVINAGANQLTLKNLGYSVNQAPGSTATSGSSVTATGPVGPQGATGATGATGPSGSAGPSGQIAVGTTSTLSPGSNATVSNTGTSTSAVFNFGIPAGATGATGATGAVGPPGPSAVSANAGNVATLGTDNLILVPPQLPTGAVLDFAGSSAPTGFLLCDGTVYNISAYPTLGALLGNIYGGNGTTTFAVPDCRSRVSIGSGQGTGLTNRALASLGGEETHPLTIAELASHTHVQNAHTHVQDAHDHNVYYQTNAAAGSTGTGVSGSGTFAGALTTLTTATNQNFTAVNQNTGSGTGHNNMQPFIALNKIIKI
jgi:microcystin-dependent protein